MSRGERGISSHSGTAPVKRQDDKQAHQAATMPTFGGLNRDVDEGDPEMAEEVRTEITRILRGAGLTPEQARHMSLEVQTNI